MSSLSKAEKSYIQSSLLSKPPLRADGRALYDFRAVALETGVAPLANGSARINIGRNAHDGGGGTEILAAVKLEVETVADGEGVDGGRVVGTVSCSPAAYPHLPSGALDDLQHDLTSVLHDTVSYLEKKSWLLNLDVIVLSDDGNVCDALFMAARAALWDTKVPRTRSVEYQAKKAGNNAEGNRDIEMDEEGKSGFDTRITKKVTDFELPDYWDEGEILDGRNIWPICVTLNLLPPVFFLDAALQEESSIPLRLHLMFSLPPSEKPRLQTFRLLGPSGVDVPLIKSLIKEGEVHARSIWTALDAKLKDEDIRRNQKARDRFLHR
ncbi:hypothetical protein SERLA73DRAFT_123997 [Serpula lacrymans var. lacrymans S7.3]|uniref:Ribosomal RNA-processing protein 42 n=1 Tax=Serpula lacrymans var. lacrymans (strain S7.3) TaxID=936435 RepID=F8Q235_SERL3|nr:hypothetical protein SERLA73DRAFT_123997 [Serpula lacrymans var. lacrymans S7.3]